MGEPTHSSSYDGGPFTIAEAFTHVLDGRARTEAEYWREHEQSIKRWPNTDPNHWIGLLQCYIEGTDEPESRQHVEAFLKRRKETAENLLAEAKKEAEQHAEWCGRLLRLKATLKGLCRAGTVKLRGKAKDGGSVDVPDSYFFDPVEFSFPYGSAYFRRFPETADWPMPDLEPIVNSTSNLPDIRQPIFGVLLSAPSVEILQREFREPKAPPLASAPKKTRGRKPGDGSYRRFDGPLVKKGRRMYDAGEVASINEAAKKLAPGAHGHGSEESRAQRLAKRMREREPK